jgi:hypothetical protein
MDDCMTVCPEALSDGVPLGFLFLPDTVREHQQSAPEDSSHMLLMCKRTKFAT